MPLPFSSKQVELRVHRIVQAEAPLNMVRKWLGHAWIETTAIYADAVGPEERTTAARMCQ